MYYNTEQFQQNKDLQNKGRADEGSKLQDSQQLFNILHYETHFGRTVELTFPLKSLQ